MQGTEMPIYEYTIKDGQRKMTTEASRERSFAYLGELADFELRNEPKKMLKLTEVIYKNINYDEPTVFIWNKDYAKSVFAAIDVLINRKDKTYYSKKVSDVSHSMQSYLSGEYHDASEEYDMYSILYMVMNKTEIKNYLNPQVVRNIATARKMRKKRTFFFFLGTKADFNSSKWQIDEMGDGMITTSLSSYLKVVDLNVLLTGGGR